MEECCENRKTVRSEEEKKALIARINRLTGQLNGVKGMIEDDRYCGDILIQLAAVVQSAKSLSNVIIDAHMRNCVVEEIQSGKLESVDEILTLIKRFQ